jgi:hypothetical protein
VSGLDDLADAQCALFDDDLPVFPVALPDDELRLLASLPDYGEDKCVQEVAETDWGVARRLEKRGLLKIHRWKNDPIAIRPALYAGRLPAPAISTPP